jgi:hypothetical protein
MFSTYEIAEFIMLVQLFLRNNSSSEKRFELRYEQEYDME